jgi:hypothetical protein
VIDPEVGRAWQKANDLDVQVQDLAGVTSLGRSISIFYSSRVRSLHHSQVRHGLAETLIHVRELIRISLREMGNAFGKIEVGVRGVQKAFTHVREQQ